MRRGFVLIEMTDRTDLSLVDRLLGSSGSQVKSESPSRVNFLAKKVNKRLTA